MTIEKTTPKNNTCWVYAIIGLCNLKYPGMILLGIGYTKSFLDSTLQPITNTAVPFYEPL